MSRSFLTAILTLACAACTSGAGGDLPADGASSTGGSLLSGTRVDATIQDALSSRTNKPGKLVHAIVSGDVKTARGSVVIPAGSNVTLRIEQLDPGSDQVRPNGRLALAVNSVTVNGRVYPVQANLGEVPYHLQGRDTTTDGAARIGAATPAPVRYAYRDVIVSAGTPIAFMLARSLNVSAR